LGNLDDVSPDDPVFILRRAISYRNSTSRHRVSAPLDEIALQHLHRESASSAASDAHAEDAKHRQPSRQEIIAAQRAATRAKQNAIVSAQTNSVRGVDVLLPSNAVIRSSRIEVDDKTRYSYVEPDGETYDISDIVEEEWRDSDATQHDVLEGVITRNKDAIGDRLDRVLNKIKIGKTQQGPVRTSSPLEYPSAGEGLGSRVPTPGTGRRTPTPTPTAPRAHSPGGGADPNRIWNIIPTTALDCFGYVRFFQLCDPSGCGYADSAWIHVVVIVEIAEKSADTAQGGLWNLAYDGDYRVQGYVAKDAAS
jgi:hypothetical protein